MYMLRLPKLEYYTKTPKNPNNKQIVSQRSQSEIYLIELIFREIERVRKQDDATS